MLAMRKIRRGEQGFSILESLIVIAIILIMLALAVAQSFGSMESYRANAAMDTVVAQLRVARQLAISQRRNVTVSFGTSGNPQTITYQVVANPGDSIVPTPVTIPISTQVKLTGIAGEPDTPMAFGTCAGTYGVCIAGVNGGPPVMEFNSLGQFTDATLVNTLNGTVFLAIPSQIATPRAVTIMGSTGRVRSYTYIGGSTTSTAWIE